VREHEGKGSTSPRSVALGGEGRVRWAGWQCADGEAKEIWVTPGVGLNGLEGEDDPLFVEQADEGDVGQGNRQLDLDAAEVGAVGRLEVRLRTGVRARARWDEPQRDAIAIDACASECTTSHRAVTTQKRSDASSTQWSRWWVVVRLTTHQTQRALAVCAREQTAATLSISFLFSWLARDPTAGVPLELAFALGLRGPE